MFCLTADLLNDNDLFTPKVLVSCNYNVIQARRSICEVYAPLDKLFVGMP